MTSGKAADNPGDDPQPIGPQISFPWDIEPPDKWKIQFQYTRIRPSCTDKMNDYSLAPDETAEGGGFQYERSSEIFSGRTGYGPLRMAWDTNILIDYAKYGEMIWADDQRDPPVAEERYQEELIALRAIMNLWTFRDIRIRMPFRQIWDAKLRLDNKPEELWQSEIEQFNKTQAVRLWQIEQFRAALSCVSLDTEIDANVEPYAVLSDESSNDDWDRSLVEEAIATGCHVFLARDRKLKKRLERMTRDSCITILSPTEMLDSLAEADELSIAQSGPHIAPDLHKLTHVMDAHEGGYPHR
jgi:hypothetical protein